MLIAENWKFKRWKVEFNCIQRAFENYGLKGNGMEVIWAGRKKLITHRDFINLVIEMNPYAGQFSGLTWNDIFAKPDTAYFTIHLTTLLLRYKKEFLCRPINFCALIHTPSFACWFSYINICLRVAGVLVEKWLMVCLLGVDRLIIVLSPVYQPSPAQLQIMISQWLHWELDEGLWGDG